MGDNILPHILIVLLALSVCCTIVQNFIMQDTINEQKDTIAIMQDTIDTQEDTIAIMQDTIDTQEDTIATMQEIIDILEESR